MPRWIGAVRRNQFSHIRMVSDRCSTLVKIKHIALVHRPIHHYRSKVKDRRTELLQVVDLSCHHFVFSKRYPSLLAPIHRDIHVLSISSSNHCK